MPCNQAVKQVVGEAVHGNMHSAAHEAWKVATAAGVRMLSPQIDFLLRLLSTAPYVASMIMLTLQARPCSHRKCRLLSQLYIAVYNYKNNAILTNRNLIRYLLKRNECCVISFNSNLQRMVRIRGLGYWLQILS